MVNCMQRTFVVVVNIKLQETEVEKNKLCHKVVLFYDRIKPNEIFLYLSKKVLINVI